MLDVLAQEVNLQIGKGKLANFHHLTRRSVKKTSDVTSLVNYQIPHLSTLHPHEDTVTQYQISS